MKLTKCIYGNEFNPKKTPFGFLNDQIRTDSVINNAGWFNIKGQRLGSGDLSIKDLQLVSKTISNTEAFFVLSEADTTWNLSSDMDRTEPGIDYVIKNCVWVAGRLDNKNILVRVRDDISAQEEAIKDGVKYNRLPRKTLYDAFSSVLTPKTKVEEKSADKPAPKVSTPKVSVPKVKAFVSPSIMSVPINGIMKPISAKPKPIKTVSAKKP